MPNCRLVACAVASLLVVGSPAVAGPDWIETGNAGSTVPTAQKTFGVGPLITIQGTLSAGFGEPDYEDMYLVTVTDPEKFSMTIASADFDAAIWVFNVTMPGEGFGLLGNLGTEGGGVPFLGPNATDGSGAALTLPGVYAIAVSGAGRRPVSNMGEIFSFDDPYEVSGPDGPGGFNPHIDWIGEGVGGSYIIEFDGVGFYDVPTPGGLLILASLALVPRRRRRSA